MTDPALIRELETIDERRAAATVRKDRATLEALLADDLHYVHSSAVEEDKATYVERACTGWYDYRSLTPIRREWRIWGDTALCNGDVRIQVVVKGATKDFVSRYLQVWRRGESGWRMASWQSTPVAPEPERRG
jgi:ketosteroid isomerase-like protein